MDLDKPTTFSSSSERTQWYKQKKLMKRKHQKDISAAKKKQQKFQQHDTTGYSKRHERRLRKAFAAEEKRQRARERKRKERSRRKLAACTSATENTENTENTFKHRMDKKRAVEKLQSALPYTPTRRTATMAAYLNKTTSPTVQSLQSRHIVTTTEYRTDMELGKQVLDNISETISKSKTKRNNGKRAEMHTILASVSGENISQSKAKTNLAKRLGVSVRRISGGQRLRGQVLTSDKSCWLYTKQKARSDKISDETKKRIYDFWMSPGISRPTGNKQDVKRHRTGPKCYISHPIQILEKTQTDVYEQFIQTHPSLTISQRAFEKLKPFFVKPVRPKDKTTCCCRYHIEFSHAFKKCMQFRKSSNANNEQLNSEYPVFERSGDLIARTLCQQSMKACLDRTCDRCGVSTDLFSSEEMDESEFAPDIEWERYEYQTVKGKSDVLNRKLILIKKKTKVGTLFKYLLSLLKTYPRHQFNSEWQNKEAKFLMEHIPEGDVVTVHDFSENYRCTTQKEIQSTYFQKSEVTIHVTILHRHHVEDGNLDLNKKVQEQIFVISPDVKHDHHFTYYVQKSVVEYLNSINYPLKTVHEFTDGCASQYKSRHCFGSLNIASKKLGVPFIRNFYETAHAKGPQDAAGGFLKQAADMAVLRGQTVIQSAKDFYTFVSETLKTPSETAKCSCRVFKYVEDIPRDTAKNFQPVSHVRSLHQIISTHDNKIIARDLSCYCDQCLDKKYEKCENKNSVGAIETLSMKKTRDINSLEIDEIQSENVPMYELVNSGDVIAVKAYDEDYYLLKVTSPIYTLQCLTTDDFRTSYNAGTKVIKGCYYCKNGNSILNYKLDKKHTALVPAYSVVYICSELKGKGSLTVKIPEAVHMSILANFE